MNRPPDMRESKTIRPMRGLREIAAKFAQCLRDDRGAALAEFLIVSSITLPLSFYLYYPDNGFYYGVRIQYDLTTLLLTFPGP